MNYIGDHPLNLIGRVAVVTSASSELGAAICRSLLNSNAFVLGIDNKPAHQTTRSTAASHFQFLEYHQDGLSKQETVEKMKRYFLNDRVDFLVEVVQGRGARLEGVEDMVDHMNEKGGLLLMVMDQSVASGNENQEAKQAFSKPGQSGFRRNVIVSRDLDTSPEKHTEIMDADTRMAMDNHMEEHRTKRESGKYHVEIERDVANMVLFCCSQWGERLNGLIIGVNGNGRRDLQYEVKTLQ